MAIGLLFIPDQLYFIDYTLPITDNDSYWLMADGFDVEN